MFDKFISGLRELFAVTPLSARRRFRRSAAVAIECLEVRRMLTAPAISAPATLSVNENSTAGFSASNSIVVSDTNGATENYSIVAQNGTLAFGSTTGLTVYGSGTGVVTASGSLSDLNTALATLVYTPNSNFTGQDSVIMDVQNAGNSLLASAAVAVTVNPASTVPPTLNLPSTATSIVKGGGGVITTGTTTTVTDTPGSIEEFSAVAQNGTLNFLTTTGLTVYGNGTGTVVAVGDVAALNQALATFTYSSGPNSTGQDVIAMDVQNTGNNLATSGNAFVAISPYNSPPTLNVPATINVTKNGGTPFVGTNTISVYDANGASEEYSVVAQHGTLTFNSTDGLTVDGNGTGTVIVTGLATAVNSALLSLVYAPNAGFVGTDTIGMAAVNQGNGLATSAAITANTTTTVVPPTLFGIQDLGYLNGGIAPSPRISLSDNTTATEDFSIVVQHGTLTFGSTTGLTVDGNGTGTVVLEGSVAALNAALQTLTYVPDTGVLSDTYSVYVANESNNLSASGAANIFAITHV